MSYLSIGKMKKHDNYYDGKINDLIKYNVSATTDTAVHSNRDLSPHPRNTILHYEKVKKIHVFSLTQTSDFTCH